MFGTGLASQSVSANMIDSMRRLDKFINNDDKWYQVIGSCLVQADSLCPLCSYLFPYPCEDVHIKRSSYSRCDQKNNVSTVAAGWYLYVVLSAGTITQHSSWFTSTINDSLTAQIHHHFASVRRRESCEQRHFLHFFCY